MGIVESLVFPVDFIVVAMCEPRSIPTTSIKAFLVGLNTLRGIFELNGSNG